MDQSMRDMTGRSVEQAREAYNRFMDASRRAQDILTQTGGTMADNASEIQRMLMRFTQENTQAGFDFAARLAQASDISEIMRIQSDYARQCIDAYTAQAQQLSRLVSEAGSKANPKA